MSDEGVVDLSEAPEHSDFGGDTNYGEGNDSTGDTAGSVSGSLATAAKGLPGISSGHNIAKNFSESLDRVEKLFDGEATLDDLLAQVQAIVAIEAELVNLVSLAWANKEGPDLETFVSTYITGVVDFMLAYFQPLQDLVGAILGNKERILVSALMWQEAAGALTTIGEHVGMITLEDLDPAWEGAACASAGRRLAEFQDAFAVGSMLSTMISDLMKLTADFADRLNSRAKAFVIDAVLSVAFLIPKLLELPPVVSAIVDACIKITQIYMELIQLAIQAARVYLQGALLMGELLAALTNVVPLLDRMADQS